MELVPLPLLYSSEKPLFDLEISRISVFCWIPVNQGNVIHIGYIRTHQNDIIFLIRLYDSWRLHFVSGCGNAAGVFNFIQFNKEILKKTNEYSKLHTITQSLDNIGSFSKPFVLYFTNLNLLEYFIKEVLLPFTDRKLTDWHKNEIKSLYNSLPFNMRCGYTISERWLLLN